MLAAAFTSGCLILILIAWRVAFDDMTWSGATGTLIEDSMQYLWWVREASEHVLVGSRFSFDPETRVFLHPGFVAAGMLHRVGLPVPIAYAIWIPPAAALLCWSVFAFVRRNVPQGPARVAALALALFFAAPFEQLSGSMAELTKRMFGIASWEAVTLNGLWGYPFSAVGVALTCFAFVVYARDLVEGRKFSWPLVGLVLLAGWLQPWQGATVIAVVFASEAVLAVARRRPSPLPAGPARVGLMAATAVAGGLPLFYYWILGHYDPAWSGQEVNLALGASLQEWWMFPLSQFPIVFVALLALRGGIRSPDRLVLVLWPAAAIGQGVMLSLTNLASAPSHALRGVAIPLSVLTVIAIRDLVRSGRRAAAIAAAAVTVVCGVTGAFFVQRVIVRSVTAGAAEAIAGDFMEPDEVRALQWLDRSPTPGGVVAGLDLASMVPWRTGRQVWFGHGSWSPNAFVRHAALFDLYLGFPCCSRRLLGLTPARFMAATGARFALVGCHPEAPMVVRQVLPAARAVRRFGCATVIELKPGSAEDVRTLSNGL